MGLLCLYPALPAQVASINTNLLGRIDSKRVAAGSPFFVKSLSDWKQGSCRLRRGDTLEGRVVGVDHRTPGAKREQMQVRFLPQTCAGEERQVIVPILVALQSPQLQSDDSMLDRAALMGAFASMIGASHQPGGGPPSNSATSPAGRSITGGAGYSAQASQQQFLRMAEVRGFPGMTLSLPTLTTDPTAISASRELLFDPGTRFVLVVRLIATKDSTSNAASVATTKPSSPDKTIATRPPRDEPADLDNCVEGGCALAESPALRTDGQLERRLSLAALGYKTRGSRVLRSLAEDAAVRFLGNDQLLVTFDAHRLIHRSPADTDRQNDPRMIRALLVSVSSGKVLHTEDWRVNTDGPYLWPLANGRVLAHVGDTLRVYGEGMAVEKQWTLPGSLASVHVAPSRNLLVAVVIHERHTAEQHRRLQEFLGPDRAVEEDYDLTILDSRLAVVGSKQMAADPQVSEILDSGLLLGDPGTRQRWKVREIAWDSKQHDIVQVHSSCPLRIGTLPTNLILLVGCTADASHSWYKVVRTDGKTLLTGTTASNDWLENADALTGGGVFAIGIVEAARPIDFAKGMLASEFQKIAVSVYSTATGRRLYSTQSPNGAVNRQSFALSESGDRLAILSGEDVSLYKIADAPQPARSTDSEFRSPVYP